MHFLNWFNSESEIDQMQCETAFLFDELYNLLQPNDAVSYSTMSNKEKYS